MNYKIITHAGTFHADEVLAIATLLEFMGEPVSFVVRKYEITEDEYNDPETLVLDVGRRNQPELGNFDHHQNGEIEATNILVLNHLCEDEKLRVLLKKYLFTYVDSVDRGHIVEGRESDFNIPSFNAIIRNLNNIEGDFDIAVALARTVLQSFIATAKKAIESEARWNALEKDGRIAIQHDNEIIVGWHELAEKENILLLVSLNVRVAGSYQIITRSTDILKIPANEKQTFLHANGFIASYGSYDDAIAHAKELTDAN